MKLLTRKALLQRNLAKQKQLDEVVTTQPLIQGTVTKLQVVPPQAYRVAQSIATADTAPPPEADQRPLKRSTVSKDGETSTFVRLPPSQRPIQRPVLKAWEPPPPKLVRRGVGNPTRRRPWLDSLHLLKLGYGDLDQLQSIFKQDVTFVAIDTESERSGLLRHVVEIGISTLEARDVFRSIEPGPHADNWVACVRHNHIVVANATMPDQRMGRTQFGSSTLISSDQAKAKVVEILQTIKPRDGKRRIAFVGHSLQGDLDALRRSPNLQLDLLDSDNMDLEIVANFDTHLLGSLWKRKGAFVPSLSLSGLATAVGVNPKYFYNKKLRGWHNASNDAAYTMMVLLKLLARGRDGKVDGRNVKSATRPSTSGWTARIVGFLRTWFSK